MENLKAILQAGGLDFSSVVKTTLYLKSMGDFKRVNDIYGAYFQIPYPARSTIAVGSFPGNVLIEIDAVAVRK